MKTYCLKNNISGRVFKVFFSEEEFKNFLKQNPDIDESIDCIECDDAPSITLE